MMRLTKNEYVRDRYPRYGTSNPERIESRLWCQLLAGATGPARRYGHMDYEGHWSRLNRDCSSLGREARPGPRWAGRGRFGQSKTFMPDGRIIYTGGCFEDFYDPDFCIYNDVIVQNTNGSFEIYLYPQEIFPPTDFHTATRVQHDIYLIGGLGFQDLRRPLETHVLKLNTKTYRMQRLTVSGYAPGWIYEHSATYERADHSIDLSGGSVILADNQMTRFEGTVTLDIEMLRWC